MCEILVRVRDRDSRGDAQRQRQLKAGDVVAVVDDGHVWGQKELANPDWRVFRLAGIQREMVEEMVAPRLHQRDADRNTGPRRVGFDVSDEWLRRVIQSGQVIAFTDKDVTRLLGLKVVRNDGVEII